MAYFETWVNRDLTKIMTAEDIRGTVFTLDNLGNLIGVRVFRNGEPVTLSGTVNGYCILADGTTVPVAGTRSGNTAYIILPQSAYAVPGMIRIAIKLTDGSAITTLAALIGSVTRSRTDEIITPSQQVITDWSQQIAAEMQAVDAKVSSIYHDVLDSAEIKDGYVVDYADGAEVTSAYVTNYAVTDYIEIETPCKLRWAYGNTYSYSGTKMAAVCTYDENKNFIHAYFTVGESNGPGDVLEYDENVKYIRYNLVPESVLPKNEQYLMTSKIDHKDQLTYFKELLSIGDLIHAYIYHGEQTEPGQYTQYYYCTDYIEVPVVPCEIGWRSGNMEAGDTVEAVAFYDGSKNWLYSAYSAASYAAGETYVNDGRVKYVRYNVVPNANTPYDEQYLNCYIDPVDNVEKQLKSITDAGVRTSVILSKDGSGDFTTWRAATEYCWTHPNTDVHVHGGVYNLVDEYGETYFQNIPSTYDRQHSCGPECGYNCRYIFSAGAKLVFNYTGSTTLVATYFAPVNIVGSCEFENMRIECSNCRYCVHEDMACFVLPIPKDVKVKYINCHMKHSGNTLGSYRETWCIGAGGGIRSVSDIIGGVYESDVGSITYHLPSQHGTHDCEVHIKDAYCTGGVQTTDYPETNDGTIYLDVCGCSLIGAVVLGEQTVGHVYNNIIRSE